MQENKSMQEIEKMIHERLFDIGHRLEGLEHEFCNLQEDSEIIRFAVNLLLDWADDASIQTWPLHQRKTKDDSLLIKYFKNFNSL